MTTHHTLSQSAVESSLGEGSYMGAGGDDADPVYLSIQGIDKSSFEDQTIFFVGYNVRPMIGQPKLEDLDPSRRGF